MIIKFPSTKRILVTSSLCSLFAVASSLCAQDVSERNVPPSFPVRCENAVMLYQELEKRQRSFAKSQFETSDEFASRIRGLMASIRLSASKTVQDQVTFCSNDFKQSYDADKQVLSITLDLKSYGVIVADDTYNRSKLIHDDILKPRPNGNKNSWLAVELLSTSKTVGSAMGSNAFGVKKKYRIKSYVSVNLGMNDPGLDWKHTLEIQMPVAKARVVSENTLLAITGTPMFPFISKSRSSDRATISDPEEAHYFDYYVLIYPIKLSVFDLRSGEVPGLSLSSVS